MFDECLIEKIQHLFMQEAEARGNWEEVVDWGTATDERIIQTALKKYVEYLEKEITSYYI